jgi:hypothetical protein
MGDRGGNGWCAGWQIGDSTHLGDHEYPSTVAWQGSQNDRDQNETDAKTRIGRNIHGSVAGWSSDSAELGSPEILHRNF